jgi:hypothetical protein
MRRVVAILVLCLIASIEIACSRRTARAVRLPSASDVAGDQRHRTRLSADEMRDAIESLKSKLRDSGAPDESAAKETAGVVSQSGDASTPATGVGTSGALSVETRHPAPPDGAASEPRRYALSRAGDALRRAAGGMSVWVIGLCAFAAALIVVLLMRQSHHSA